MDAIIKRLVSVWTLEEHHVSLQALREQKLHIRREWPLLARLLDELALREAEGEVDPMEETIIAVDNDVLDLDDL